MFLTISLEFLLSSSLVDSSKIKISESLYSPRAIPILCLCPPDNFKPLSPIFSNLSKSEKSKILSKLASK